MTTPEQRRRAGRAVAARIADLQTSVAEVARRAQIDPRTLRTLANGTRWPRAAVRARITDALHWPAGEITRRAIGGRPGLSDYTSRELLAELCDRAAGWPEDAPNPQLRARTAQ